MRRLWHWVAVLAAAFVGPEAPERREAQPEVAALVQRIAESEYFASRSERGLQAPNRAHDLRTFFAPDAVRVETRTAKQPATLVELRLASIGRGAARTPVEPGEVAFEHARVSIARPELGLVEWYVNSPAGLEQGFDLAVRPAGDGPLVLEVALARGRAQQAGEMLQLVADDGARALHYGKLFARDAAQHELPARIELADARAIRLVVDDTRAEYPIVVDPLISEVLDTEIESNQMDALFSHSLAAAGDVNGDGYGDFIVGAPAFDAGSDAEGAAFVFHGLAGGLAANLAATSAEAIIDGDQIGAELGVSVSGAGDVNGDGYDDVIIGAHLYDAGHSNEGAAFVYHGGPAGVLDGDPTTADATIEGDQTQAEAGYSVAGAGDVNGDGYADVVVGAHLFDNGFVNEGAAGVYHGGPAGVGNGSILTADALLESDQTPGPEFAHAVDGAGDVNADGYDDVVVGAYLYDAGQTDEGALFVFHGGAAGVGSQGAPSADDTVLGGQGGAGLGFSVAGAGDYTGDIFSDVLGGAPFWDGYIAPNTYPDVGVAVLAAGSAAGATSGTMGDPSLPLLGGSFSGIGGDQRGYSVAFLGDIDADGCSEIAYGAPFYQNPTGGPPGEIGNVIVLRGCDGWFANSDLFMQGTQADARFGESLAGAGDLNGDGYADALIGAPNYDSGQAGEGSTFIFEGSGLIQTVPFSDQSKVRFASAQAGSLLGISVAGAGDVNGDSRSDLIVGAPNYDAGQPDEGAAFIFHGTGAGVFGDETAAATRLESNEANADFGARVAGAGDVNGDGYGDVIVGAVFYDGADGISGSAFIFHGSGSGVPNGNPATADTELRSTTGTVQFATAVAGIGDVNGDGYGDVALSSPTETIDQNGEGAVYVYNGGYAGIPDGTQAEADARLESDQAAPIGALGSNFGVAIAGAGDVNGDGYAELLVGAPLFDAGQPDEGAAFIFHGSATGIPSGGPGVAVTQLEGNATAEDLGFSVAGANDVNLDGFDDVIVGSQAANRAYVFHGGPGGVSDGSPASANTTLTRAGIGRFGYSVAGVGDINGDRFADVFVGSPALDPVNAQAIAFPGGPTGVSPVPYGIIDEAQLGASSALGVSVAGIGDWNRDGFADVAVGDSGAERVTGWFGNDSWFVANYNPRQGHPRQLLGVTPAAGVQPFGLSGATNAFRVNIRGPHPEGRRRVKLQVEACPPGSPFGVASCATRTQADWIDSAGPPAGVLLDVLVDGLVDDTLYHWRARVLRAPFRVTTAGITPPPNPSHGPWRRLFAGYNDADIRTGLDDADADAVSAAQDNCPTASNAPQTDTDADGVGDACDNCTLVANPRVTAQFARVAGWMTRTGGQRDDDADGFGNRCDGDFPGTSAGNVGPADLAQFRASNGESRTLDTCGTNNLRPCAIYDLDENTTAANNIGPADLARFRALQGSPAGPRCLTCPHVCQAGPTGFCPF